MASPRSFRTYADLRDYLPSYRNLDDRLYSTTTSTLATKQVVGPLTNFTNIWSLVLSVLPLSLLFLDYHLAMFLLTNRTGIFHSYHCQPTIYQRENVSLVLFSLPLAVPAFITILTFKHV